MNRTGATKAIRHEANTVTSQTARISADDIVIGKDILELLTSAMYVDPMTIYREYVQNAADSVDNARVKGILRADEPGQVSITIDPSARSIRIRDNGSAIAWPQFVRRLTALGASSKRGTAARGFRGVGRLAGLGYAQELIFRSRTSKEKQISELRWDCRRLKASLKSAESDISLVELIQSIVQASRVELNNYPERFFEVELKGIVRLRSDKLLSPNAIAEYLAQVAPVPFSPAFKFGSQITSALRDHVKLGSLQIRIDGSDEPIYRPHRDTFIYEDKAKVTFDSVDFIKIPGMDGDIAAIGWVLHHDYEGAVPNSTFSKGLRLRSGNLQVGDHTLLEELFPEPRFNAWSVGEIHVIDKQIVPNGRRDHFEQNAHYNHLINHLTPTARDIARRCRTNSVRRNLLREFELLAHSAQETTDIILQQSVSRQERERLALSCEQTLMKMAKIARMELLTGESSDREQLIDEFKTKLKCAISDRSANSSPLTRLPKARRKTYEQLFELIYKCSTNRAAAKALIDRILMNLDY
ncbi:MAG: ATP-binding protein [Candidatus Binataceae bacterium]